MDDARAMWNERYRASDLVWSADPNQFVVAAVGELSPGTALDLACGEGRNTFWLAQQGWTAKGVDFSVVAVERARGLAVEHGSKATFEVGDVTTWMADRQFDLVVLCYLHLPSVQRTRAMRNAASMVGQGGTLFVVAHDARNLADGVGGPQDPDVLYTVENVVADVTGTGLDLVKGEVVPRRVIVGDKEANAWDVVVHLASVSPAPLR